MRRLLVACTSLVLGAAVFTSAAAHADHLTEAARPVAAVDGVPEPAPPDDDSSLALFGDEVIDLREGWQGATACTTDGSSTVCFATEAEMDAYLATIAPPAPASRFGFLAALQAVCGSSARLYTGSGYSGNILHLSTRYVVHNLSASGFDNVTSSYKIGACGATFYDGIGASGSAYPGYTGAGAQATAMVAGWDNRVSSVYLA